jgi:hypothetical protein
VLWSTLGYAGLRCNEATELDTHEIEAWSFEPARAPQQEQSVVHLRVIRLSVDPVEIVSV